MADLGQGLGAGPLYGLVLLLPQACGLLWREDFRTTRTSQARSLAVRKRTLRNNCYGQPTPTPAKALKTGITGFAGT